jgi:hypothetical protein
MALPRLCRRLPLRSRHLNWQDLFGASLSNYQSPQRTFPWTFRSQVDMSTRDDHRQRPCDQCRRRKVKCNYVMPCDKCQSHDLPCAFTARNKRGPRFGIGPVINELRARPPASPLLEIVAAHGPPFGYQPAPTTRLSVATTSPHTLGEAVPLQNQDSPMVSTNDYQQVDWHQVEHGVHLFCETMYYIYPVVDRQHLQLLVKDTQNLRRVPVRLLHSICALTLMAVDAWPSFDLQTRTILAREHIRRSLQDRTHSDYAKTAAPENVLTSLFIAVTFFDLKCRTKAWFYIREAITLAQLADMHSIDRDSTLDPSEKLRRQRIYALLYVTERGAFIHDMLPVSIFEPPELPSETLPDEDPLISSGLGKLFRLFSLLSNDFVRARSGFTSTQSTGHEFEMIADMQDILCQDVDVTAVSEIQRADILITQQWLRLMVWQTALKLGLISSTATNSSYSYSYPQHIALALCAALKRLSPTAIEVHGLGIVSLVNFLIDSTVADRS